MECPVYYPKFNSYEGDTEPVPVPESTKMSIAPETARVEELSPSYYEKLYQLMGNY